MIADKPGYKRPPRVTQFKPGKSGNPKGRPKGARNFKSELKDELCEVIRIKEQGHSKTITKQRALIKSQSPLSKLLELNIAKTREKLGSHIDPESLSIETLGTIRQLLRPDFEMTVARSATIRATEEKLVSFTEDQYQYLDVVDINDRALVTGAAGTGKTLLALEYAKREHDAGRSVLLFCFNRLLGEWLREEVRRHNLKLVTCKTFHAYLHALILRSSYAKEFEDRYDEVGKSRLFAEHYPLYGELAISELGVAIDTLIIDEAQDLLADANLAVLNAALRGGLAGGRWAMFGDFTRQAIFSGGGSVDGEKNAVSKLQAFGARFSIVPLKTNCRNSRQIGEETALLSGFESLPYRLTQIEGLAVDYRYVRNQSDEAEQLEKVLNKLLKEGVATSEIVILSPNRFEGSAASRIAAESSLKIRDIRDVKNGTQGRYIPFTTIHAFKGMESPTVVLCGISDISDEEKRSLLYVGMSRARSHLVLLLDEKTKALIPSLVSKRLSQKWKQ